MNPGTPRNEVFKLNPDRHLWEYRWARDLITLVAVAAVLSLIYQARAVVIPVLIGLGAAYAVNPLVTFFNRRWKVARWYTTGALLALGLILVGGLMNYILPKLIQQITDLIQNLPPYLYRLGHEVGIDWETLAPHAPQAAAELPAIQSQEPPASAVAQLASQLDLASIAHILSRVLGVGLGYVSSVLGSVLYLGLVVVIAAFCFFFFSTHFEGIVAWFDAFVPSRHRDRASHIIARMDRSVSAFVRGRAIQCTIIATILTFGWALVGVPYWMLLGLLGGLFHIVPYGASATWPIAIGLTWIDAVSGPTGFSAMEVLVLPSLVYFVAQSLDGWIVEPLVQGKATDLDPLSVMLAVMLGGSLAGILGLILAVPIAACTKILVQELLLPRLRRYSRA